MLFIDAYFLAQTRARRAKYLLLLLKKPQKAANTNLFNG